MKKKLLALSAVATLATTSILPIYSYAEEQENEYREVQESSTLTIEELLANYQISDASFDESIYTVTYENNGVLHTVVYDGNSGNVTIDGVIQSGITYEYNPELALHTQNNSTNSVSVTPYSNDQGGGTTAVRPGYRYVGTIHGHTERVKNAVTLASGLATLIPGIGWKAKVVSLLTGYQINEYIPSSYYSYGLYEKGFMTNNWYQYSSTRFYTDAERQKPMGPWWTNDPQKINLSNS